MCEDKVISLISDFSDRYLDDELKNLNIKLAHKLSENVLFADEDPKLWAGGIIYAIGQLNFLFDYEIKPYVSRDEIPYYFSLSQRKVSLKSRDIRRMLKLKLGNEEFSTEFILSLNIPENDVDLKCIRVLNEVKHQIFPKRPKDVDFVDNSELEILIDKISNEKNSGKYLDEMYLLLRQVFFIRLASEEGNLIEKDGDDFKLLVFTSVDKCKKILGDFEGLNEIMGIYQYF